MPRTLATPWPDSRLCWLFGTSAEQSRTGKLLLNEPVGSYLGNQARRRRLHLVRGRKRGRDAQKQAILLRQLLSCAVKPLSLTTTPPFHEWLRIRISAAEQQKHMVSSLATPPSAALGSSEWMLALQSSLVHTTSTASALLWSSWCNPPNTATAITL